MSRTIAPRFERLPAQVAASAAARAAQGCFQHPGWVRAVAVARGRPHTWVGVRAQWPDGREALLFGAIHRRFGLPVFESMPMGAYGGWVGSAALGLDEERELNRAWLAQTRWPLVVLTTEPGRGQVLPAPAWQRWPPGMGERLAPRQFVTHLLDLAGDDLALLQRVRPRMRSYLRHFDQLRFEFTVARDAPGLARLSRWYRQGSQAWQRPNAALLPEGFFTALADSGRAEVWSARYEGREVGAALFLVGAGAVQYQASGTQRIDAPVSAMEALLWAAARHYRDRGLKTMNLGASEGLDSVARFKHKFGARAASYLCVSYLMPAWWRSGAMPASALAKVQAPP